MARARWLFGQAGVAEAEELISSLGIEVEMVTVEQARVAVDVFGRFGKGHPARLNMGDCFAYALSKTAGAPLLFKGEDFPRTDISAAL
ncbi:MAG: PIN domain-containing protein [Bryobacteraceae bacterium]